MNTELIERAFTEVQGQIEKTANWDMDVSKEAFLDIVKGEMTKEAMDFGLNSFLKQEVKPAQGGKHTVGNEVLGSAGKAIGAASVAAIAGLGGLAVSKALGKVQNVADRRAFERSLERAVANNAMLRDGDEEKINRFAETIFRFAPNVAKDPNLLANILSNSVHYESLDLETIRAVTELEEKHAKNNPSVARKLMM